MRYLIGNVLHRIRCGWQMYLLIMIEIIVGGAVLCACTNLFLINRHDLEVYRKTQMTKKTAVVSSVRESGDSGEFAENLPPQRVTYQQYRTLRERYQDELEFAYSGLYCWMTLLLDEDEFYEGNVACMDDSLFEEYFSAERKDNTAYVGDEYRRFLEKTGETIRSGNGDSIPEWVPAVLYIVDGVLFLPDGTSMQAESIDTINQRGIKKLPNPEKLGPAEGLFLDTMLVLPVEYASYFDGLQEEKELFAWDIFLVGSPEETPFSVLVKLVSEMTAESELFSYRLSDEYMELEKRKEEMIRTVSFWLFASVSMLCLVAFSLIGLLVMQRYRYRRSSASAYACGCSRRQLYTELFLELLFLTGAGCVGSAAVSIPITRYMAYRSGQQMTFYGESVGVLGIFGMLLVLVCYIAVRAYDGAHDFYRQLKEE